MIRSFVAWSAADDVLGLTPIVPIAIAAAAIAVRGDFSEADILTIALLLLHSRCGGFIFSASFSAFLPIYLPSVRRFG
jgi:hypothetical protein